MVSKEEFFNVLTLKETYSKEVDKLADVLNLDIWSTPIIDSFGILFDSVIQSWFTEEGANHVFYFIYESNHKVWVNGKPIPFDTLEDLWNFVKDYRK
jgi:hypothetical protein